MTFQNMIKFNWLESKSVEEALDSAFVLSNDNKDILQVQAVKQIKKWIEGGHREGKLEYCIEQHGLDIDMKGWFIIEEAILEDGESSKIINA